MQGRSADGLMRAARSRIGWLATIRPDDALDSSVDGERVLLALEVRRWLLSA